MTDMEAMMIHDEGERLTLYTDTRGKLSIGIGHNLIDKPISKLVSRAMFMEDLADAIDDVNHCCSVYDELSRPRQLVMVNLAFNLGRTKLAKFVRFWNSVHLGHWDDAANHLMDSDAARQLPARYARLAKMMREDVSVWV